MSYSSNDVKKWYKLVGSMSPTNNLAEQGHKGACDCKEDNRHIPGRIMDHGTTSISRRS
jgi:hypothetical protein